MRSSPVHRRPDFCKPGQQRRSYTHWMCLSNLVLGRLPTQLHRNQLLMRPPVRGRRSRSLGLLAAVSTRVTRAGELLRNAASNADRHGHGCPSALAMQHSVCADPTVASTVSHELLSSKHKRSSLAGTARTAASGQSRQRRSRAARPLWSGSGGRGGVSDLGGGGQPTAEANLASTSGSRSASTRNVALCARRPRDARWNKSD